MSEDWQRKLSLLLVFASAGGNLGSAMLAMDVPMLILPINEEFFLAAKVAASDLIVRVALRKRTAKARARTRRIEAHLLGLEAAHLLPAVTC